MAGPPQSGLAVGVGVAEVRLTVVGVKDGCIFAAELLLAGTIDWVATSVFVSRREVGV